jgi:hypothetical protein
LLFSPLELIFRIVSEGEDDGVPVAESQLESLLDDLAVLFLVLVVARLAPLLPFLLGTFIVEPLVLGGPVVQGREIGLRPRTSSRLGLGGLSQRLVCGGAGVGGTLRPCRRCWPRQLLWL